MPEAARRRHHSTGADAVFDLVKTPATCVPGARTANNTSVRSRYVMPAWPVASLTPANGGGLANVLGARGERGTDCPMDFDAVGLGAPLG